MDTQAILSHLRQKRDRLEAAISALEGTRGRRLGNGRGKSKPVNGRRGRRGRRKLSAAAKRRISEAAKKRWAAAKKAGKNRL